MSDHPFVPGARVAIASRYSDDVREGFVDKVHKSGRFTLRGSKQQWKPWCHTWSDTQRWSASETGDEWTHDRLELWDATTDKEISERIEATRTKQRWRELRAKIDSMREATPTLCDAIEAALTAAEALA